MSNKHKILLFCIFFIALFLRLYGNNWDQGWHLHPDERFLTMVGVDVKIPSLISQYLDQHFSSFNPVNKGHTFFVYGTFPILINKALAQFLYNNTYELFNLQGRVLSGLADFFVLILIYKLIELVENKLKLHWSIKFLSAFFYAIAVLPIQLSHFFTVDTFLNLFCWASLYYAIKLVMCPRSTQHITRNISKCSTLHATCYTCLSGIFLGLALACKVSAVYFAPLVGLFIFVGLLLVIPAKAGIQSKISLFRLKINFWIPTFVGTTLFLLSAYLALRFGSPYYFETANIFNPQLSKVFLNSIQTLKSFDSPSMLFPPAIQWLSKSYGFPLKNIIFFGVGPVYFLLSLFGIYLFVKKKNIFVILIFLWVGAFLIYQSVQFTKTMRYLIFIYPLLAICAAIGFQSVIHRIRHFAFSIRLFIYFIISIGIVVWPLAFMSIYTVLHSRVAASYWIYNNVRAGSTILSEYWDDPLPLMVYNPTIRNYVGKQVHIFDPDSQKKWIEINDQLSQADYYIMSSNRGWGSISEVPSVYPDAAEFYTNMMKNKRGYTLIKTFSSYPSLRYLGIPIDFPDQWAEEAFTVYDHPLVMIFKRN
jgi:hypothetical protein